MSEHTELFTIGEIARRTGLPVRTIRFWSDSAVVAPTGRSAAGYRLYDAEAVARLDLVRTLRELGLDLDTVRRVLARQATVRDMAGAHLRALDAEIRTLQVRRAVLRWVARRGSTTEEMRLMHKLARMSADERQRIIDDFVHEVFHGVDLEAPGAGIAQAMLAMPAELPADPTSEQVDAWIELAELVGDGTFRRRVREMAVAGVRAEEEPPRGPEPAGGPGAARGGTRPAGRPVGHLHGPRGGAVLAVAGHPPRPALVATAGARVRMADRRAACARIEGASRTGPGRGCCRVRGGPRGGQAAVSANGS
ncbi:MerR family transcriptional regulator [Streptomyces sp. SBT349]|uniref:MerR family transcriptional regulator n=1 Tax=Streptomyces sp. SBT349 TaxID=1580539 RepID=UPI000AD72A5E|nr:MerR family transcriptional regulator [Streptomyces sp. SBT349]